MATHAVSGDRLERAIRMADRTLDGIEREALSVIDAGLVRAARQLETELSLLYREARADLESVSRGSALREARARVLLAQVRSLLDLRAGGFTNDLQRLTQAAYVAGNDEGLSLLSLYDSALIRTTAVVPVEVISAAGNAAVRFASHGQAFATKATEVIVSGMARGQSWSRTATELRREVGITRARAETIVRTESVIAADTARRASYEANGIEHVQRVATQDQRICVFCAARAGNVYRRDEAPAALHPRDRCVTVPWSPRFQELGLTNDEWYRRHREGTIARLRERGEEPSYGLAPFEKAAGLKKPPEAVWKPY